MTNFLMMVDRIQWWTIIILCGTLGLAPFSPPHFFEKLLMLFKGNLIRPIDWFDFFMHGFPWALLVLKVITVLYKSFKV
ncbi:RND transporter [Candidatus Latescibacterota bacterium]